MNKTLSIIAIALFIIGCSNPTENLNSKQPVDYVNPHIDTHQSRWFFFASAARLFGMVGLSPNTQTKGSWKSGYLYDSLYVRNFSHIHGWQLSGIPVMPTVGEFKGHLGMETYKSSFSHDDEIVKPGYHKIVLKDYNIQAELTSTSRVGFHKYTYPKNSTKHVIFDVGMRLGHSKMDSAHVEKISEYEITGYSIMSPTMRRPKPTYVYFIARFDQPISNFGAWKEGKLINENIEEITGENIGVYVEFDKDQSNQLQIKVAISYTNIEQALLNMDIEFDHWNFDAIVSESQEEWNNALSRIKIKGGTENQKIKLYTDLWHSLLGRKTVSDVDGKYADMTGDEKVIRQVTLDENGVPKHQQYNFDAWWGSHWTLNVLWSMVYPEVMNEFCASMLEMYKHGGLIPRGPSGENYTYVMIGDPAVSFFATAYNKGIRNYDIKMAYEGLYKNAFEGGIRDRAGYEHRDNSEGSGMNFYVERGYVPEGIKKPGLHRDGASMTMEYAYQDWCLSQISIALGKTEDANFFAERSKNYKNLWNPETKFIHSKNMDGSWIEDFEPIGEGFNMIVFCESNSAIYTNYLPHDVEGLMELFGGKEKYTEFLNSSFEKAEGNKFITGHGKHAESWVDYENQPGTQMAHLFNHTGSPWLSQKWVRTVKETTFGDVSPYGGYNGDEDQGQMGALGVLMAMGLFQMDGGASINSSYEITTPLFDEIEIELNSKYYPGEKFVITTENNSEENIYIQKAELNGENWTNFKFSHDAFSKGGELKLKLGSEPNKIGV